MASQADKYDIDLPSALLAVRRRKRRVAHAKAEAAEIKFLNIVAMVDVLTILLIFLLKSVSVSTTTAPKTPNLLLPMSTTQTSPLDAVSVTIAKDKLFVGDEVVANINKGAIPDTALSAETPMLIPDLQKALMNWLRLAVVNKGGDEKTFNLEILADKDTPYYVLLQVSYTAGQSYIDVGDHRFGYDKYRLKVRRAE